MASAGCRQIYGSDMPITKSRRRCPQIDGGGSACARLYLRGCYPLPSTLPSLTLLLLRLLFSSSSPLFFPSPLLLLLIFLFSSSSSNHYPSPLFLPPLFLLFFCSSSSPPPLFLLHCFPPPLSS